MPAQLSKAFTRQLITFFENHPPMPFSIFLRNLILEYIRERMRIGFPLDFGRHLWSLEDLFELLDAAEREFPTQTATKPHTNNKRIRPRKSKKTNRPKK